MAKEDDLDVYEKQGLGTRMGFGKNPALIVVDFINGFNGCACGDNTYRNCSNGGSTTMNSNRCNLCANRSRTKRTIS